MAEELVSMALEQLTKVMEQVELVIGAAEEAEKLGRNLQSIQGVLVEAERRQLENHAIKQWLDNLKEVSYSIDDVLDEWNTEIMKQQIEEEDQQSARRCFEPQFLQFPMLRQVCSSIFPISCFSCFEIGKRYIIAREIKKLNARLDDIAKERKRYDFDLTYKWNEQVKPLVVNSAVDVTEVKGRQEEKNAVIKMLMCSSESVQRSNLQVVSIVGMGGLGKSTLAKLVYNDSEVEKYFDSRIWVSVSKPFEEIKIAKAILEILLDAASVLVEFEAIMQHIGKLLKGKMFLLVLDDVWEDGPSKWEQMRDSFMSASIGSSILVTTRVESVAVNMACTRDHLFKLGNLSVEECWSIFSEIAFFVKNNDERAQLRAIGMEIVKKCDGLPLAAKTLGNLLRFKDSWQEWQSVLNSEVWELEGLWGKSRETQSGFASLWLSYYDMVSELKPCFSYCAILPKDYEIKGDDLIQMWMAQGYLRQTHLQDMERIGEKYLHYLGGHSFFEIVKKNGSGQVISCKMYNIVHDFAQYIRKNECFSIEVNDGAEELKMKSLHKEVRHLRVVLRKDVSFPSSIDRLTNLRTLWIQCKGYSKVGAALSNLFSRLTCLRSLNLSNCNLIEIPSSICKLIHLRQIDLSHNKDLKELPEALCELCNLQTLNVNGCFSIVKLPHGIKRLINLRHLHNGGFEGVLPKGIRRLTCLRSLDRYNIGQDNQETCTLGDLKNMNHLQGYLCIRGLENVADASDAKQAELKKKTGVTPLELRFGKGGAEWRKLHDGELLQALEPSPYVEELRIYDYQGRTVFPSWMICLTSLKTVHLTNCKTCEHLPPLGKLPFLENLRIWGMDGVKKVGHEFLGLESQSYTSSGVAFPRLMKLRFVRMRNLEGWADELIRNGDEEERSRKTAIMPQLQSLSFAWCPKLKVVPDQLLGKATLEELILTCSPFLKQRYQKGTGHDWHKISQIPNIKIWNFGEKRLLTLLEERGLVHHR